jgi:cellulose synthase/poly-beta-1,6-N-acetylglucosamine synthase-like glycosyltransferase
MQSSIILSILIAVRNEENYILPCLESLMKLDFPTEHLEILIGNDASTDHSRPLIEQFIQGKKHFKLIDIQENIGKAKAKANVLAHLARDAQGEFLLFTDADVKVPSTWAKEMLRAVKNQKVGAVIGWTSLDTPTLFAKMQAIDWLLAFSMVHLASIFQKPITAMGNNLLIRKSAYLEVGGYEQLNFSLTEDFVLFHHIVRRGYSFIHLCTPEILVQTKAETSWTSLLAQRKRWSTDIWYFLDGKLLILLVLEAFSLPLFITFGIYFPSWSFGIWLIRLLIRFSIFCFYGHRIRQLRLLFWYFGIFEIYQSFFLLVLLFYLVLQKKIVWKGRTL